MNTAPDDWLTVARCNDVVEAQLLLGRLQADGIETALADHHHVQADPLIALALGGVRVQVRARDAAAAAAVIAALASGDYALKDDFDPGERVD